MRVHQDSPGDEDVRDWFDDWLTHEMTHIRHRSRRTYQTHGGPLHVHDMLQHIRDNYTLVRKDGIKTFEQQMKDNIMKAWGK